MEDMIHHTAAVSRGAKDAFVVADMPFMSYQTSVYDAVVNAGRLMKEGRANAVKLEGGVEFAPHIEAIVKASIPVVAHIGLTPQSVNAFGGFKVQGKDVEAAKKLLADAKAVEAAGATWRPHADPGAYELIVNTVPQPLFTGQVLSRCKKEVCILDLASGNGGVDLEICKAYGICAKRCPGLPARYAPKAAAKILADVIEKEMDVRKKGE